jgi:hypothetical protein
MRFLILLLFFLNSALATEAPTAETEIKAAKEARESAMTTYRIKLVEDRKKAENQKSASLGECLDAKNTYLRASAPLADVDAELKKIPVHDSTPEVALANKAYLGRLNDMKAHYEAQLTEAKKRAKSAGTDIVAAEIEITNIGVLIKQLDEQVATEKRAEIEKCREKYSPALAASACRSYVPHPINTPAQARDPDYLVPRGAKVLLPKEFGWCFPDEAIWETEPEETGVPLPSFPVQLYPFAEE